TRSVSDDTIRLRRHDSLTKPSSFPKPVDLSIYIVRSFLQGRKENFAPRTTCGPGEPE
ncbi:uncharacterized, partial [Tachysurus ichikawai]